MAPGGDPPHQFRVFGRGLPDQEKGGVHALTRQRRQHPRRRRRPRTIIEGQHHLVVIER
jgi:hypothetical protein